MSREVTSTNKHSQKLYKTRNRVQRGIGKLKDGEAIALPKARTAEIYKQAIDCEALFGFWI